MNIAYIAAIIYSILTVGIIAFQIALALGVPWGSYAMGGAFPGKFPPAMRLAAVVQAVILGLMAAVVLSHAGLSLPHWSQASTWLIWGVVTFAVVSIVLNAISPSAGERRIWVPVATVLFSSSLAVALSSG